MGKCVFEDQEFLARIAIAAKQVQEGQTDATPEPLRRNPGMRAIYNALLATHAAVPAGEYDGHIEDRVLTLAQRLDTSLRDGAPNGWRGVVTREKVIKGLIFDILKDEAQVERLFPIVGAQDY